MFEPALVSLLTSDSGINSLVGTRIYPVQGPPDNPSFPYVTYKDVTATSEYTLDGAEARRKRIQFDLWCLNDPPGGEYLQGRGILIAFRNLLSGYDGVLTDGTRVLFASRENEIDNFDNDSKSYRSICEYEFLFVEQ